MDATKKSARGQGGRKETYRETEPAQAHKGNDAASSPRLTPSFDVEGLIRAGLTLIPLHRWNAIDARGRQRGKSPLDPAWQAKDYDSREVLERARRSGLNVGVRMGEVETVESTRDRGIAVTVYFGTRKGSASTADLREESLSATVEQACAIARHTESDPAAGLADAVVIGSRIIEEIEQSSQVEAPARVTAFIRGVREAMDAAVGQPGGAR